jgi:hypothetical protein
MAQIEHTQFRQLIDDTNEYINETLCKCDDEDKDKYSDLHVVTIMNNDGKLECHITHLMNDYSLSIYHSDLNLCCIDVKCDKTYIGTYQYYADSDTNVTQNFHWKKNENDENDKKIIKCDKFQKQVELCVRIGMFINYCSSTSSTSS